MRVFTLSEVFDNKSPVFDFDGEFFDAFDRPSTTGIWFIWGKSGNGKTTFALQLAKYLTQFGSVLYNSLEQGASASMRRQLQQNHMLQCKTRFKLCCTQLEELRSYLLKKRAPRIVFLDSVQYLEGKSKDLLQLKQDFPKVLFIFVSQAEGQNPMGKKANDLMYAADLKILVSAFTAASKGRFIGPKHFTINNQLAEVYSGEIKQVTDEAYQLLQDF